MNKAHALPEQPPAESAVAEPSVSSILFGVLQQTLQQQGVAREHLTALDWEPSTTRVPLQKFAGALALGTRITGDVALGLHCGYESSEASFDVLAPLMSHAPTLRDALLCCQHFQPLLIDDAWLHLSEQDESACVRLVFPRLGTDFDRIFAEFVVSGFTRLLRTYGAARTHLSAAYFEHTAPAYHREYTRIFHGLEHFQQPFTGLRFARTLLDQPHLHHHPQLHSLLYEHVEDSLRALTRPRTTTQSVRLLISHYSKERLPEMAEAARLLGVSERSLRRKLTQEGSSYRDLVEESQHHTALRLLRDPRLSIQETAHKLGFADSSAFNRAFKRWTGITPSQYRAQPLDPE